VYTGAVIIDGTGAPPIEDGVILVEDGRITAIAPKTGVEIPEAAERVDISGKWIIPGLIDAHIHFFQSGGLFTRPDIIDLRGIRPYEEEIRRIREDIDETFARYIASGVTGVVDVGGPFWNFAVRAHARKTRMAPHVAVAGPLIATVAPPEIEADDPPIVHVETPAEARAEVRRQLAQEPDLIKIWFVYPEDDIGPDMAWVRAAIEEAHAGGVRVVAHGTQLRVARALVEAGVDILAHSVMGDPVDDALLAAMKRRDVVYITTFAVYEGYEEVFSLSPALSDIERRLGDPDVIESWGRLETLPEDLVPRWAYEREPRPLDPTLGPNLQRVHEARITVAAGSDAGNIGTPHGPALHRELELMVTEGGLSPMDALIAATRGSAKVMGREDDLGTLEPGKRADFVVLDADPLADIRNTRRIHRVVKGGMVFNPREIARTVLVSE